MSAEEFAQWIVWMDAEQVGPAWDRLRHAQLLAAAHNGGRYKHSSGRAFVAEDFSLDEPWAEPALPPTREALSKQLALELVAMESAFDG